MRILKYIGLILFLGLIESHVSQAQISPGDLAQVHSHLEGLSNCTKCHTLGDKVTDQKCLDCHKEIQVRINEQKGYHVTDEVKAKKCFECHNDHHGRKFQIIRFDKDLFDHNLTGYKLEEAHAEKKCEDCHNTDHIADKEIAKKEFTYLGLDQSCLTCHEDFHQGDLDKDCFKCHSFKEFRPASKFDHNKSNFILKGAHKKQECEACHKIIQRNGKDFQQFKGLKFQQCTSCHEDVHNKRFGSDCTKCHSQNSFSQIKNENGFNHKLTDFPLEGLHRGVECKKCHKSGHNTDPVAHKRCLDCHKDYHKGEFRQHNKILDCSKCHSLHEDFTNTSYSFERHQQSAFPLKGAHQATPCFACHRKTDRWSFRNLGEKCLDCHENFHQSALDQQYYNDGTCYQCHDEKSWHFVEFDHNNTAFKLQGKHEEVSCRDCHFKEDAEKKIVQNFSNLKQDCLTCHEDEHHGQFNNLGGDACLSCHAFNNWEALKFNHNKTRFPLEGKHIGLDCIACHELKKENGVEYVLYKLEKLKCEDCH